MVFISIRRPSTTAVKTCLEKSPAGQFNYEPEYMGVTQNEQTSASEMKLRADGYVKDHTRVRVGSGRDAFTRCKGLVKKWGHFQLGWTFVDSETPIQTGGKVCVCGKALSLWTLNPLQIVYVDEAASGTDVGKLTHVKKTDPSFASNAVTAVGPRTRENERFAFGHGTLKGHFLAGEERFSVEWRKEDDSVWYEILAFSKPAHVLSLVSYPLTRFLQKQFAQQSVRKVREHLQNAKDMEDRG